MVKRIIEMIENGEILLADAQTQDEYVTLSRQGLMLDDQFAACIGGNWFYFMENCNGEYLFDYKTNELAEMIAEVINNPEENGLDDGEVAFYKAVIA